MPLGLSTLFARLIVACRSVLIVGSLEGSGGGDVVGFPDGFCFVDLNFVGVFLMCPFEVSGDGLRCFWTE